MLHRVINVINSPRLSRNSIVRREFLYGTWRPPSLIPSALRGRLLRLVLKWSFELYMYMKNNAETLISGVI